MDEHLQPGRLGAAEDISVLLIADPGEPAALAARIAEFLPQRLRSPDTGSPGGDERRWTTCVRRKPYLPDEQAELAEVIDAVDPSSEEEDIVVYLTDLPRREDTMPVVADVSADHRFALISVAGVGGLHVERRVRAVTDWLSPASSVSPSSCPPAPRGGSRLLRSVGGSGILRRRDCGDCDCCRGWCGQTGRGDWSLDCRRSLSAPLPRVRSRWQPARSGCSPTRWGLGVREPRRSCRSWRWFSG